MNAKAGMVLLALICLVLAIGLIAVKKSADEQQRKSAEAAADFSNQLVSANASLTELSQVNIMLTNDLAATRSTAQVLSNHLVETSNALVATAASLQTAQAQITNLTDRVAELEAQNQDLGQRLGALSNTIASLDTQITLTQMQLATARTNNAFLASELKKQVAQRAELERQFNDLKAVKAQLHKLKTDALVARRLEWIREGIDPTKPMKGAQLLMSRAAPPISTAEHAAAYDLNVEVRSDGSVRILPATNAPAM